VVVVLQDDPPARTNGARHSLHDAPGFRDMLQEKAGVRDVKRAPLAASQRQLERVALAPLRQPGLAGGPGRPRRPGNLLAAALDAEDTAGRAGGARHGARELAQPASHLENALAAAQTQLAQRRPVDQIVEPAQAPLLERLSAVQVPRPDFTHCGLPLSRWRGRVKPRRGAPPQRLTP